MVHSSFFGCSDGQPSPQANASLGVTACSQWSPGHPIKGPKCSSEGSGPGSEAMVKKWLPEQVLKQTGLLFAPLDQVMQ